MNILIKHNTTNQNTATPITKQFIRKGGFFNTSVTLQTPVESTKTIPRFSAYNLGTLAVPYFHHRCCQPVCVLVNILCLSFISSGVPPNQTFVCAFSSFVYRNGLDCFVLYVYIYLRSTETSDVRTATAHMQRPPTK